MHVPENGNRQPAKFMERLGTPLTQIGLSHCELMVRFAIFRVPSRHELRTWQCADGLARTTGRLRAFAFQRQQPVRSGRAIGAKGPRPLQRRNLTPSRAGSSRNEEGVSHPRMVGRPAAGVHRVESAKVVAPQFGRGAPGYVSKLRAKSVSIARAPESFRKRVPVPVNSE
jgi:hypothetical protein